MAQFVAFAEGVEVNGQTVLSMVEGMEHSRQKAMEILARHGIIDPQKDEWFPQQAWLNAFKEIAETIGSYALYCIGVKIPENADFPPEIDSLEKALSSIDIAYKVNHRGGEIGYYRFSNSEDGSMHFTCKNPYHCEFDRGIIEGIARKYVSHENHVFVKHDDSAPCREKNSDSCTYHIEITSKKKC